MDYESLESLYLRELKDLVSAEKQIIRALPKMIKCATAPKLRDGLEKHLNESKTQLERLEKIFARLGKSTRGAKCRGIEGIIEEGAEWMQEDANADVMDAGIIATAQRIEHYEIASYGCARTYAGLLQFREDEVLLDRTLQEEGNTDKKLTTLAEKINVKAAETEAPQKTSSNRSAQMAQQR
ncbi:MAG TPA: ferritin-like domain-containing protein [Chthoniobacteraceae bacterium]|nr:ferritin-like domain-containing protein [Chthoniobacteraceae bacterium]